MDGCQDTVAPGIVLARSLVDEQNLDDAGLVFAGSGNGDVAGDVLGGGELEGHGRVLAVGVVLQHDDAHPVLRAGG